MWPARVTLRQMAQGRWWGTQAKSVGTSRSDVYPPQPGQSQAVSQSHLLGKKGEADLREEALTLGWPVSGHGLGKRAEKAPNIPQGLREPEEATPGQLRTRKGSSRRGAVVNESD